MALNNADRLKLAEIERRLEQDPTLARVFGRGPRMPRVLARSALCAVVAYLASLATVFLLAGGGTPVPLAVLLALPPVVVTLTLLRWPGLLRLPAPRRRHRRT